MDQKISWLNKIPANIYTMMPARIHESIIVLPNVDITFSHSYYYTLDEFPQAQTFGTIQVMNHSQCHNDETRNIVILMTVAAKGTTS